MTVVGATRGAGGDVLRAARIGWRRAFDSSPIGAALVTDDGTIVLANDRLGRLAGCGGDELTGTPLDALCLPGDTVTDLPQWTELLAGRRRAWDCERHVRGPAGQQVLVRLSLAGLPDEEGDVHGVMVQVQDITAAREAELALAAKAMNDDLTGLPNRWLTREWVERALAEQPAAQVGVLSIDLDRTKNVNESLGHTAGDRLIVEVAYRLREALGEDGFVGRVGGDEFLVVCEAVRDAGHLVATAAAIVARFTDPVELGPVAHTVTLSIGAATGVPGEAAEDLVMRSDIALARAKRSGGACTTVWDPDSDRATSPADLALERELRASVSAGELRAFYQPIVALPGRELVGYEALVRWAHSERGLLVPDMFLRIAESSGLIGPIGGWMLDRACTDALGSMPSYVSIAVNTSPLQLQRPGFVDTVARTLAATGLPAHRLHLEITESALVDANQRLRTDLQQLRDMGVTLALDDFGTGYSSLTLLQDLPVQVVKIDRSFVAPLLVDDRARAVVRAVLGLCADLGLDTVAEGVEEPDQLDALVEMGCARAQGFYFGRPAALSSATLVPQRRP